MKTIFVVDDSNVNLYIAEATLSNDYRVYTLTSAKDMFILLKIVKPDIILLDIQMPEMDGFETLVELKKNDQYADIPVIFLSTLNDANTKAYCYQIGAVDFIEKPFSTPELRGKIKFHLDMSIFFRRRIEMPRYMKSSNLELAHYARG